LLGPLECHDDVRKISLKQECFEMSPEWMQWLCRCNFARQTVPQTRCSNRESSVANRWQSDMRHHQAIGVCGAESSMTKYIGNMD